MMLGDGSSIEVDIYSAFVIWDSQPRTIRVQAVGTDLLVGMKMLVGYELRINVVAGGSVWLDVVP